MALLALEIRSHWGSVWATPTPRGSQRMQPEKPQGALLWVPLRIRPLLPRSSDSRANPPATRTSVGAAAPGPLLTLHVLQLYDFHLGVPPLAPDVKRHVGVLKQPLVSLGIVPVARAQSPSGAPRRAGPGGGRGVYGNSHRRRGRHSGDGLAVAGRRAAHGSERGVPRVVRTGSPGARAVPIARAGMPVSRNFESISARSVGGWPQAFPGGLPPGLLAWSSGR